MHLLGLFSFEIRIRKPLCFLKKNRKKYENTFFLKKLKNEKSEKNWNNSSFLAKKKIVIFSTQFKKIDKTCRYKRPHKDFSNVWALKRLPPTRKFVIFRIYLTLLLNSPILHRENNYPNTKDILFNISWEKNLWFKNLTYFAI